MFFLQPGFFRLFLALAVVVSHLSNLEIGRPAVFAFFALSGFWVMRMYDEKYSVTANAGVFYLSRLLRIWLPFAVAYLAFVVIRAVWFDAFEPRQLLGLGLLGIASSHNDVLGVSWSLDLELQFYLLVPLLWLAISRLRRTPWAAEAALVVLAVLAGVAGWGLQLRYDVWTVLSYLPCFVAGIMIWLTGIQPTHRMALGSLGLFLAVAGLVWLLPESRGWLLKDVPTAIHEDWFGMAWVALLLPFIALNVRQPSGWLDQHLGNYSYAIYITHWPVVWITRQVLDASPSTERLAALAAVGVVSVLFYIVVDRGAERLRQRIVAAALRTPASASHTPFAKAPV